MKQTDVDIIKTALSLYGDSFWTDKDDSGADNLGLVDDVLEALGKSGYDLRLKIDLSKLA